MKTFFNFLPYIIHSVIFNFKYLPLRQALYLPILLYKPNLKSLKGSVQINSSIIKTGMIRLGTNRVSIYPNAGIMWQNSGEVIFNGDCNIGNASNISIGKSGVLSLGDNFQATAALKLVCYSKITFKDNVLVGWDCIFTDTDFHKTRINEKFSLGYKPIKIGSNNWFSMKVIILKGTETPNNLIIGANSLLNRSFLDLESNCLIAGSPAQFQRSNVYRDPSDDKLYYD